MTGVGLLLGAAYRVRARLLHRYRLGHTFQRIRVAEPSAVAFLHCTWCGHSEPGGQ